MERGVARRALPHLPTRHRSTACSADCCLLLGGCHLLLLLLLLLLLPRGLVAPAASPRWRVRHALYNGAVDHGVQLAGKEARLGRANVAGKTMNQKKRDDMQAPRLCRSTPCCCAG